MEEREGGIYRGIEQHGLLIITNDRTVLDIQPLIIQILSLKF